MHDCEPLPQPPLLSVAAPVYNEEDNIEPVLARWQEYVSSQGIAAEFVLCDDGSTDHTGEILARLKSQIPILRTVAHDENRGYGNALASAIAHCKGQYILTIDSDGQFDLADVAGLLHAVTQEGYDAAVGRRTKKQDTWLRVLADRALNAIVRVMFGTRLHDTNCALKLVPRETLQGLRLDAAGYAFATEIALKLEAKGLRVAERPVQHIGREAGRSKLKALRTGWRMFRFLLHLRARLALYRAGIIREP